MEPMEKETVWDKVMSSQGTFLLLLLVADLVFIVLHFLLLVPGFGGSMLSLVTEGGHPELYQYLKELWIAVLMLCVLIKTRCVGYGVWSLLFLFLLLDDSLRIHETFGGWIAARLNLSPAFGLRAQDFGELLASAVPATVLLGSLGVVYVRCGRGFQQASRHLLLLVFALAFFGLFTDMLHVAVKAGWKVEYLLGAVEDGGEMLVMSGLAAYAFSLNARKGMPIVSLWKTYSPFCRVKG